VPKPPFARGRNWVLGASASKRVTGRVWRDRNTGFAYQRDPNPLRGTRHEIDARRNLYRDLDPQTGAPVNGSEVRWRPLK
jgi:hypothetical protein